MSIKTFLAAAVTALIFAAPASAKNIGNGRDWRHGGSGKRLHEAEQPAVQDPWASNRWGLVSYHWRFGDHYFDGI